MQSTSLRTDDRLTCVLPDFIIIGAPKAGTTWLARCLRQHPGVFLPQNEIQYWTNADDAVSAAYESHFAGAAPGQIIGERSNSYLIRPDVAAKISRHLPAAKLLALLRNPIDRAYSGYCMRLRNGQVTRDIDQFLDPERSRCPEILDNSLYGKHIKTYLAHFTRDRMHFVIFDDIEARPAEALTELSAFLGIDPLTEQMLVTEKINSKEKLRFPPSLVRAMKRHRGLKALGGMVRETSLGRYLRKVLPRSTSYPPLSDELRARLAAYFRADIDEASSIVGRDLRAWVADSTVARARSAGPRRSPGMGDPPPSPPATPA